MFNYFANSIDEIYQLILQPIDIMYKLTAINNCKSRLNIGKHENFGDYYYKAMQNKKEKGVIYTPKEIANYIIKNSIKEEDIIKNPFMKIADPTCGSGNLIIPCYNYLIELYENNLELINQKHSMSLTKEGISKHIIENNLFGFDIDEFALNILIIDLYSISFNVKIDNFYNKDFLLDENNDKFDVFIGNPPYIGQKSIDKHYSSIIKKKYKELYKDKGDISYCFFGAALNKLIKGGKLTFITSRYFLESPSGEELRKTLQEFCSIDKIIDFYGIRPFKNVGIDPVIIFLKLGEDSETIQVVRPLVNEEKEFVNSLLYNKGTTYTAFKMNKNLLNKKGWILRDEAERCIINKIERKCFTNLGNICNSYQGIITGCDKAFVIDDETVKSEGLEDNIIKPWIKSSSINKGDVYRSNLNLIYSNLIENEDEYPNCIRYISPYKDKLKQRRECRNGIRLWYELQWGRVQEIFEEEKIVFPFKANRNRFSIDKGSYFSADVYCLRLKENTPFTYRYLIQILNSKLYEYYFKTFAKKLGEDLYEYYPNNLMKLCIPTMLDLGNNIDETLYKFFELSSCEVDIINKYISK